MMVIGIYEKKKEFNPRMCQAEVFFWNVSEVFFCTCILQKRVGARLLFFLAKISSSQQCASHSIFKMENIKGVGAVSRFMIHTASVEFLDISKTNRNINKN
jgi:hypothetical protein